MRRVTSRSEPLFSIGSGSVKIFSNTQVFRFSSGSLFAILKIQVRFRLRFDKNSLKPVYKTPVRVRFDSLTKIAVTACKFSKIFRGSMAPDPLELFLSLNQLQISSAENNTIDKKIGNYAPPPLRYLATPLPALIVGEKNQVIGFGPLTLEMLPPSLR